MRMLCSALGIAFLTLASSLASAAGIRGDYVEARTADVFTGPCFSNAEVFIYGNHAVLAWKVDEGAWKGVDLRGLCVAAAINGTTTFSEDQPDKATAVLIVDTKASGPQREALIDLAKTLGGARLNRVTAVRSARMSLKLEDHAMSANESTIRLTECLILRVLHSGQRASPESSPVLWTNETTRAGTRLLRIPHSPVP